MLKDFLLNFSSRVFKVSTKEFEDIAAALKVDFRKYEVKGSSFTKSNAMQVLNGLNDGLGINAAARTFGTTKKSINRWLKRLGNLKEILLVYALCHQFLEQIVEGDELYTKVGQNIWHPIPLGETS